MTTTPAVTYPTLGDFIHHAHTDDTFTHYNARQRIIVTFRACPESTSAPNPQAADTRTVMALATWYRLNLHAITTCAYGEEQLSVHLDQAGAEHYEHRIRRYQTACTLTATPVSEYTPDLLHAQHEATLHTIGWPTSPIG